MTTACTELYDRHGNRVFSFDQYTATNWKHWNWGGNNLYNANIIAAYSLNARSIEDLKQEEYSSINEEANTLEVDINKMAKSLYERNKFLEEENIKLKEQQYEQDEILIENAFAIANIELGGLY